MKRIAIFAACALLIPAFALADDHKGNQTHCPIMGGEIVKDVFTDYKDNRIFFCCPPCEGEFLKNAEENLAKMKADGIEVMKLKPQSICPVSGQELKNKDIFVDVNGKRVYLCCSNCVEPVKSDPEKYIIVIAAREEFLEEAPEK